MKVSIDRERCTNVGLCAELDPTVFILDREDGLVRFRAIGASACVTCGHVDEIDAESLTIDVPVGHEDTVTEAARECPSDAILIHE